jgi:hypothetical protein
MEYGRRVNSKRVAASVEDMGYRVVEGQGKREEE